MSLFPLFATPVFKKNFEFEVPEPVESDVVFEEKGYEKLREFALKCSGDYFYGIMKVSPETGFYITKSYLRKNDRNNRNSIITGIIMLSDGSLTFTRHSDTFQFIHTSQNEFNSTEFTFKIKKGDFIVFPSTLDYTTTGETITWYTFVYNIVNENLFITPPPVFGKPKVHWEII